MNDLNYHVHPILRKKLKHIIVRIGTLFGILLFVREDIPCKIIKTDCDVDFEEIFVEINLRKKKWLLCCS